jgi:hypothetical protein
MYHIISSDLIDIDFFLIYLNFSSKYNSIWGGIMTFQNMCYVNWVIQIYLYFTSVIILSWKADVTAEVWE